MIGMALLMSPELFVHLHGFDHYGQFKAVVLLGMLVLALVCRFEDEALTGVAV